MCDTATQQLIENVVSTKVQNNELFTAFDVTTAVRKQSSGRVFHTEVKKVVHKLYDSGVMGPDYTRGVATNLNVSPQPFLYHPMSADPTQYGQAAPQVTTPGAQVTDVVSDDGDEDEDDEDYEVDSRETLCVPALFLRAVGFKDGDTAYVSVDTIDNALVVTKKLGDAPKANYLSKYTVDSYDNVRITQWTLQRGGIGGKRFNIKGDKKKVIIRKS